MEGERAEQDVPPVPQGGARRETDPDVAAGAPAAPRALRLAPYNLHLQPTPIPPTLHPTPDSIHPTAHSLHPAPRTLQPPPSHVLISRPRLN